MLNNEPKIIVSDLNVFYGNKQAIFDINMSINSKEVTAFIGPSGCGKSTLLRCFNRMNDLIDICKITGNIKLDDLEVYSKKIDIVRLRTRVGMVFQKPNPFPKSIYDNVAYGPKIHGMCKDIPELDAIVEKSLRSAGLWDEIKDRLHEPGTSISGGQQQRLCIARAIATNPEVILMDEPFSGVDPIAIEEIKKIIKSLSDNNIGIIITDHNVRDTLSLVDRAYLIYEGRILISGSPDEILNSDDAKRVYLGNDFNI